MWTCRWIPTFQRDTGTPPTSSNGVKNQMTTMDIFNAMRTSNLICGYLEDVE
jgi:hypothetical protein